MLQPWDEDSAIPAEPTIPIGPVGDSRISDAAAQRQPPEVPQAPRPDDGATDSMFGGPDDVEPAPEPEPVPPPPDAPPMPTEGQFVSPAMPSSLAPFRSPRFTENRFVGDGAATLLGDQPTETGLVTDEEVKRAIARAIASMRGRKGLR